MRDYNVSSLGLTSSDYNSGPLVNLINLPFPIIRGVLSGGLALLAGASHLVTGGTSPRLHGAMRVFSESAEKTLPDLFVVAMRALHPSAKFAQLTKVEITTTTAMRNTVWRQDPIQGRRLVNLIPNWFVKGTEALKAYQPNASFATKLGAHVGSRAAYGLLFVGLVAGRVVDAAVMPFAVLGSVASLGFSPTLNRWAYKSLMAPVGVVGDTLYCAVKILNPWAGEQSQLEFLKDQGIEFLESDDDLALLP